MNVHLALHLHRRMRQDMSCVNHPDDAYAPPGVVMSLNQLAQLPTRTRVHPAARHSFDQSARLDPPARRPRMMRMPADWWDSPSAVGCPLSKGPQSARAARLLQTNRKSHRHRHLTRLLRRKWSCDTAPTICRRLSPTLLLAKFSPLRFKLRRPRNRCRRHPLNDTRQRHRNCRSTRRGGRIAKSIQLT